MNQDDEKSFCYVEGTSGDRSGAEEVRDIQENVWFRVKPPKMASSNPPGCVTARQIDLVRNMLLGRTALKIYDFNPEFFLPEKPETEKAQTQERRDVPKTSIRAKKSSVKFLNQSVYE